MSSSCIEEVSVPNDDWYRIAAELLGRAGIEINGSAPSDLRIKNPLFFKRVLQEGSLGLGESYMDGWWDCERLDIFFHKVLRAGLEKQLPHHFKDTLRIAGARLFNLQSKKRAWIVGKEHYDLGNDLFSRMLDPYMQYSCAYWKEAQSLEEAQVAKLDLICRKLQLEPGMHCREMQVRSLQDLTVQVQQSISSAVLILLLWTKQQQPQSTVRYRARSEQFPVVLQRHRAVSQTCRHMQARCPD